MPKAGAPDAAPFSQSSSRIRLMDGGVVNSSSSEQVALGLKLARLGQWNEAVAAYQEALRIDPNNPDAFFNLGFVYYELGLDAEAQEAFANAEALRTTPQKCDPSQL